MNSIRCNSSKSTGCRFNSGVLMGTRVDVEFRLAELTRKNRLRICDGRKRFQRTTRYPMYVLDRRKKITACAFRLFEEDLVTV